MKVWFFVVTGHLWGKPPITGGFPSQKPVTRSIDVFFYQRPNKRLSKQSRRLWFDTPSRSSWRHCNDYLHCRSKNQQMYLYHILVWGDSSAAGDDPTPSPMLVDMKHSISPSTSTMILPQMLTLWSKYILEHRLRFIWISMRRHNATQTGKLVSPCMHNYMLQCNAVNT